MKTAHVAHVGPFLEVLLPAPGEKRQSPCPQEGLTSPQVK